MGIREDMEKTQNFLRSQQQRADNEYYKFKRFMREKKADILEKLKSGIKMPRVVDVEYLEEDNSTKILCCGELYPGGGEFKEVLVLPRDEHLENPSISVTIIHIDTVEVLLRDFLEGIKEKLKYELRKKEQKKAEEFAKGLREYYNNLFGKETVVLFH